MDVRIIGLTKTYGLQKAVDDISFEVKPGEILGFLGPNGAGKTTTMKIITDFIEADSGEVLIGGQSVKQEELHRHVGYLPELNPLYDEMPVIDYLAFCAALHGMHKDKIPVRIREMVRVCGLDMEKHKRIGELSKGFRQRVGLAQAMIHDPDVLILDEPTTGLDPNQRIEIRELIRSLGRQKTVILSTHILPEVEDTCDRIVIINRGRIVADGTMDMLKKQKTGQQILNVKIEDGTHEQIYNALRGLPTVNSVDVLNADEHKYSVQSKSDATSNKAVFKLCVEKGWLLTELIPMETKLEDIFRDLTLN
jgi:gliding motility-associated transport system ATP-binding protein